MGNLVSSDEMWVVTPTPRVGVFAKISSTQVRVEPRKASLYRRGFFCWRRFQWKNVRTWI